MPISEIESGLFLGSEADADPSILKANGITHVLTINTQELRKKDNEAVYKFVWANDTFGDDLLTHFEVCIQFITNALAQGKVLIHCWHGISRSATVVCAYIMQKQKISPKEAMNYVKKQRKSIHPNEGYRMQLKAYQLMDYKVDTSSPIYRLFLIRQNVIKTNEKRSLLPMFMPVQRAGSLRLVDDLATTNPTQYLSMPIALTYKCRMCRKSLFTNQSVWAHVRGGNRHEYQAYESELKTHCTQGLFVIPVKWMDKTIHRNNEGSLFCPGDCKSKLGNFNWDGWFCGCGAFLSPVFMIHTKKVDCVPTEDANLVE